MSSQEIVIRGAREHNLRDVDLRLPKNQLICMTGVSGSGKSSLAFDTLYAEGQRRYVESLSSYARQFLGQMPKPQVDSVSGLSPSISIQQKTSGRNPRSTVGTITEIYDYLRVLFARAGTSYCQNCGRLITAQSTEQIIEHIAQLPDGRKFLILAPVVQQQKGEYRDLFEDLLKQGFLRARVDGKVVQLTDELHLDRQMRHNIEVVVDRLTAGKTGRTRLAEAVENALRLSGGALIVAGGEKHGEAGQNSERAPEHRTPNTQHPAPDDSDRLYSSKFACTHCGVSYEPPSPQLFSFNSPLGMCLDCTGLGMRHEFDLDRLIVDEKKSIAKGAIDLLPSLKKVGKWKRHLYDGAAAAIEEDLELEEGSLLTTPWNDLPEDARRLFLYGTGDRHIPFTWRYSGGTWKHGGTWDGYVTRLLDKYRKTKNSMRRKQLEKYMDFAVCSSCGGSRLNAQARAVRIDSASVDLDEMYSLNGRASQNGKSNNGEPQIARLNLSEVCSLSIQEAADFFKELDLDETRSLIAEEALKEIRGRLGFLLRCGLDYLALDRTAPTLSGGESQRIRLAGQIGCGLVGVVYILDEPSIGLHPRDNRMLLDSLCELRDQGNTVIVVEHDEETMRAADHVVDFGPGPGVRGGEVVATGTVAQIQQESNSLTGRYLSGDLEIAVPEERRATSKRRQLKVVSARHNNLKNVDVAIPLGAFVCVTGASGSGKSSLVNDILWQVLNREVNRGHGTPGTHNRVNGLTKLDKAIDIDQSPIGRTPRSNPATYVKLFDLIRDLYTKLPESRARGYKPGRFSFNVAAGRCEACEGYGSRKLEMDFLADVWIECPVCEGRRFNHETLDVRFKEKSIAEVLEMDVQEALVHFENVPKIVKLLDTLHAVGLDYLKLGQPSPTLSGGEAQRIKLARELGKRSTGSTIYLLDEPTTGLHFADVQKLLEVLHGFVEAGNTVLVVEHNLDVVKTADWVIDLGPEGGAGGGTIVAQGTPEEIADCETSYTGQALKSVLATPSPPIAMGGLARNAASAHSNGFTKEITIRGAAQHNLQNLDLTIPRNRMSVFCGPSGSGKTSLAMDTLYAEGQRRYVESLSAYARQFLGQMPKPRVEHIHGLSPAIAIEQKTTGSTPRSTVGTVTEIYDYLRILYARLGTPYCPDCNVPVETQTTDEVIDRLLAHPAGTKLLLLAPQDVPVGQKHEALWERLRTMGFVRVRIDGETHRLDDVPEIDRRRKHDVDVVVDRVTVRKKDRSRIADSVEAALDLGRGSLRVAVADDDRPETEWRTDRYSLDFACQNCGRSFEELTPHNFSFNSPLGWCEACEGLGVEQGTNPAALIADASKSLAEGAIAAWPHPAENALFQQLLEAMAADVGVPLDVPYRELDPSQQRTVLYGTGERWFDVEVDSDESVGRASSPSESKSSNGKKSRTGWKPILRVQYKGLYPAIEEASRVSYHYRRQLQDLVGEVACSACGGSRLREDAAAFRFQGKTLGQVCNMPLGQALEFLESIKLKAADRRVAGDLLTEATGRLSFLVNVGLDYVSLLRPLPTLSGGETQRIRLAGQIGRALTGVLYVLDEPTIGLHPRDNGRLLDALRKLRDLDNTVLLVEHDREVISAADRLYDFGPGAGRQGGEVTAEGTPKQVARRKASLTGQFLSEKRAIPIPDARRMVRRELSEEEQDALTQAPPLQWGGLRDAYHAPPGGGWLELLGAREHNLRDVDLRIPLGAFTCVTGVSGSGKSTLIEDTLGKAVARRLHRASENPAPHDEIVGLEFVNKVITVNQQALGNTPASNPATYTGVFDHIRNLFTRMPEARVRGYQPSRFSFNRQGGRCDDCEGNGQKCIEMHFLPDVWIECETCRGRRYNQETLAVRYRGKSIADVLEMPIGQANELFDNVPKIRRYLSVLCAIGLDYLTLGQSAPTLSGGEAQRVKLAAELARPDTGKTLYILDEPTTGLHFEDVAKLLKVLNSLVEQGNTVVVIEHNLDVIKTADWIIDMGPEAGAEGGAIVVQGTPEDLADYAHDPEAHPLQWVGLERPFTSHTAQMLAPVLESGNRAARDVFNAKEAAQTREGDVDVAHIGRGEKMPWQRDGRKWHTADRVARNGQPCRWEGAALEHVVDVLEEAEGLKPANWNDRANVEVTAQKKTGTGWFFHALTGDEWLLRLYFRVPKGTFKEHELQQSLDLKPVDEVNEIQVYGRGERVRVNNAKGPFQEVVLDVHWLREIDTPAFHQFLNEAIEAYLGKVEEKPTDPEELTPWKVLGKKWHLSRKGFPSNKRVRWPVEMLETLFDLLEAAVPDAEVDWGNKQVVHFRRPGNDDVWATVHTKRRAGVDLVLLNEPGRFALGRIAEFGKERDISEHRDGREAIKIRFSKSEQVDVDALREFLREHAAE